MMAVCLSMLDVRSFPADIPTIACDVRFAPILLQKSVETGLGP